MTTTGLGTEDVGTLDAVPAHDRQPCPQPADFFAPPTSEIAPILSAESSLKLGSGPKSLFFRLLLAITSFAVIAGVFVWLATFSRRNDDANVLRILGYILGAVAFVICWLVTRFKATCTYVGKDGIARYSVRGRRDATPKVKTLVFHDAAEVIVRQTRHFYNGVYTGTSYDYRWNDPEGRRLFRLNGRYNSKSKPPKSGNAWHFANASDVAWSNHYLARADEELKRDGSLSFRVDTKRWLRMGPGFLEFHFGGEPVRVTKDDIASVSLNGGQFSFKHKDAKWYSRSGKFAFAYGTIGNAKVFLMALDRLMGYTWN